MNTVMKVENLQKSYERHYVLNGISFSVEKGEIFALLGTNGAGKTTALECLEGIRKYDNGTITIQGKIGVQLQSSSLPQNMKVMEAVRLFTKWNGVQVDLKYLERLGVTQFKKKRYGELSTGQKRRLHLALAMIGNPDIVFLDEPTAGLDVEGRVSLHDEIRLLKSQGKTIIMASHDMAEVEELCNRIAILKDGEIAFIGTANELTEHMQGVQRIHFRFSGPFEMTHLNCSIYKNEEQGYFIFETECLEDCLLEIASLAKQQAISIRDMKIENKSLEQRFMDIAREGK
ncbi:ABC transporter ATP-binding protein [Bacillus sp. Bva_UNVM-123]|uniref:ABC transporter ATP-binding protein n=1 Tax=Bacillus sp. Bva_UNVM-123 TaxID=2829798 RepID=UPI00391F1258